jgi:hypothetical protein
VLKGTVFVMSDFSLSPATNGSGGTNNCKKTSAWHCGNPMQLRCDQHGHTIEVRCGRWRTCAGCAAWKQWTLTQRLLAGIEQTPDGLLAMFVTLTFPRNSAPDEDGAHSALRKLVARLRYRRLLGAYSWVLERQANGDPEGKTEIERLGSLHYHGIWFMPFMDDDLAEWRSLLVDSGFGPRNRISVAQSKNAYYCTKYITKGPAELAPLRRAYGFSQDFPRTEYEQQRALSRITLPATQEARDRQEQKREWKKNPLAELPASLLVDPGDQMSAVEFEEHALGLAEQFGIVQDTDACTWTAPGR